MSEHNYYPAVFSFILAHLAVCRVSFTNGNCSYQIKAWDRKSIKAKYLVVVVRHYVSADYYTDTD